MRELATPAGRGAPLREVHTDSTVTVNPASGSGGAAAAAAGGGGAQQGRERPRWKAAMASSQLVRLSSGSHVSLNASRPAQRISTWDRLHRIRVLNLSSSCTSAPAHRQRRLIADHRARIAAQVIQVSAVPQVWTQTLDVELIAGAQDVEAVP